MIITYGMLTLELTRSIIIIVSVVDKVMDQVCLYAYTLISCTRGDCLFHTPSDVLVVLRLLCVFSFNYELAKG